MIIITAKADGFRRAGTAHPAAPTEYPDDAFTKEQLKALKAEPMLVVVENPGENSTGAKKEKKDKNKGGDQPNSQDGQPPAEDEQK